MFLFPPFCYGIILFPQAEPNTLWTGKPGGNVVGRWGANASCVAISPFHVITAKHAGGGVGTSVVIGGIFYEVIDYFPHFSADISVSRLDGVLEGYVNIYENSDLLEGEEMVLGGYGVGRGNEIYKSGYGFGGLIGWQWGSGGNIVQGWGTNKMVRYWDDRILMDFDMLGLSESSIYECCLTLYDSGCGLFKFCNDQWYVTGVGATSSNYTYPNSSVFDYRITNMGFVRIDTYYEWICGIIYYDADFNKDFKINMKDFSILSSGWLGSGVSDLDGDNIVDILDLVIFSEFWLQY